MYNKKEWVSKEVITKEALNNIENGIADLDERLEELESKEVEVDLSGYQEKTDNDLVTESKDIVGAINELFQSANNGKEIIADAIGEPLNAEDTFAAMGNDIKGLLSTFKTNMMNNGVTVESSDKFKQLIDKIATTVGGNKGVQFASGEIGEFYEHDYDEHSHVINTDLDFVPTYIFVYATGVTLGSNVITNSYVVFSNINPYEFKTQSYKPVTIYVNDVSSDSFTIKYKLDGLALSLYDLTWYAIGVGEEDTTLRDSLASILEEEGVEVSEEDDMVSLITKVNSELDRKNEEIANSGGLDIISATELPATGKENQICVITDNPVDNFVVTSNPNDNANEDNIILYNVGNSTSMTPVVVSSNGVTSYNYISQVYQGSTTLASYVYYTGQWIPLTTASHYLLKNGTHVTDPVLDKLGTFKSGYIAGTGLRIPIDGSSYYVNIMLCDKSVDFSSLNFSKIKVTAYTSTAQLTPYLYVVSSNQTGQLSSSFMSNISPYLYDQTYIHASYGATKHTYELDISGWSSQTGYFGIGGTWSGASAGTLYISDIVFE